MLFKLHNLVRPRRNKMAAKDVTENSDKMFGPLTFDETKYNQLVGNTETKCLLCEDIFNLGLSLPLFLSHIFDVHNVVIEGVQNIENLHEYILYWRNKFKCSPLEQIIPSVNVDSTGQRYFLLSTLLKEDKELRHKLKLDYALKVQEFERNDKSYIRQCLFCRLMFEGTRPDYLEHLSAQHNLQLGNPQNLVYIEELVDIIDKKIGDLQCLYCEKTFPDRNILKEHMRKKLHKRINPQNTAYDKYYIVNYLEADKTWQAIQQEDDRYAISRGAEANSDEEYSDWNEEQDQITCLFCQTRDTNINMLCLHMEGDHEFDFVQLTQDMDFYQKIKLVNYIRRQTHRNKCAFCDLTCDNLDHLENHLAKAKHCRIPERKVFDQPEFYFPTYENDAFLYYIDDVD
ncbi:hypothetical protein NQ314_007261 [Rhamnusium bicolor]|uniref:C2H2-type domain-containing protein n=1 Tax=Rhamnusium bicolor TaxID=1586634 RepID=A0AAV8YQ45_9CUCU|nr:hypothetical protein NQ314_007261 [Rhamnusium bicolor]